ncbi:MAG: indolepyruvate oxidoreductase, partial [Deltaproteobacteria bacterium]
MKKKKLLLGNETIAYGLLVGGCSTITSYPGTPASEILAAVAVLKQKHSLGIHVEWSINEKVAFEIALANSYSGRRSAVAMKQVGLNVAMDPL